MHNAGAASTSPKATLLPFPTLTFCSAVAGRCRLCCCGIRTAELLREAGQGAEPANALQSLLARKLLQCNSSRSNNNSSSALILAVEDGLGVADWQILREACSEVQPLTLLPKGEAPF